MLTTEVVAKIGKSALAKRLGIKPQSVHAWGPIVPFPRQQQIQKLYRGEFKAMSYDEYFTAKELLRVVRVAKSA